MDVKELVKNLTLEEKASLCSGYDRWQTEAIERLGIEKIWTSDGPHGLRRELDDSGKAKPAVCFPAACLTAASFDRDLIYEMGRELGRQARAQKVDVLLGPGVNIKRSPLCGRNFEYFSEDPYLAGELAAEFVKGVQEEGVGTSVKHFFANSQEHRRMDGSSELDERTMREIYLSAFETVVKKASPWTVMASYNKLNGTFSTENKKYLTGVLRGEWGFDGVVVSDWGATHNRAGAVEAGCDLTMPTETKTDHEIVDAVKAGTLSEEALNTACENILNLVKKAVGGRGNDAEDLEKGHELAGKIAAESIVLLKNEGNILPLKGGVKVALIGAFAKKPRYQGGGSSHVNAYKVDDAVQTVSCYADVTYAEGYGLSGQETNPELLAEAVANAKAADVAVVFAGLPEEMESEGFDRTNMRMPKSHNELIEQVCKAQPNTVVVLYNGSPVEMPWADYPKGIIEAYLGGQAVSSAVADVLFGRVNPSGFLPESIPYQLEDNPSYLFYRGEDGVTAYNEGVFVGYRYYNTKNMKVRYPFGYGLSYTTFSYSNMKLSKNSIKADDDTITVSADVKNTGDVYGKALAALYAAPEKKEIIRPVRELRGFEKVALMPGEVKTVTFTLTKRDFSYWDMKKSGWSVEAGNCAIQICSDASAVVLEENVAVSE
ncbi:MAG: glycoside hydrolase family 3 C-terminal domain-containing protein [Clostridiales bacterium]|jgi:beta-glucosidase|nr:glycoside hydrolase family 3 C-terminal domain-containing protein [Clostridiales bacterium]